MSIVHDLCQRSVTGRRRIPVPRPTVGATVFVEGRGTGVVVEEYRVPRGELRYWIDFGPRRPLEERVRSELVRQ